MSEHPSTQSDLTSWPKQPKLAETSTYRDGTAALTLGQWSRGPSPTSPAAGHAKVEDRPSQEDVGPVGPVGLVATQGGPLIVRTLLDVAAELERDDTVVKRAILAAGLAGNCSEVVRIVNVWLTEPASVVAASCGTPPPAKREIGLDSCDEPEVRVEPLKEDDPCE